jgi:two-component system sensor histidine kinase UhpB
MQRHLRSIVARLRPGMMTDAGLNHAIGRLLDFWRQRQPGITFMLEVPTRSFGQGIDDIIFRVVQESLSNAVRHGKPSSIRILLSGSRMAAHLEIIDDGIGFDPAAAYAGFGLAGMRERVASVGGELVVASQSDRRGTVVSVRIPLEENEAELPDELVGSESLG